MSPASPSERAALRQSLRQRRRSIGPGGQRQAARALVRQLRDHPLFRRARHVAFYLANDGEIDPAPLLALAHARGKHCYLPVLQPEGRLRFAPYRPGDPLRRNRFGIPEPLPSRGRPLNGAALDLILLPLVGFDAHGGRLGMGGGFYDRTFAFLPQHWRTRPRLLGLAHACQQVHSLPVASWDVPLSGIATDRRLIWVVR